MMVNYSYKPGEIEKNHERYSESGMIAVSSEVNRLMGKKRK